MKAFFFLALVGVAVAATKQPCPDDFVYSETMDRCYLFSEVCFKYDQAEAFCKTKNANLTSIRDAFEDGVVYDLAQLHVPSDQKDYWIGGKVADTVPPQYIWVTGDDFEFNRLHDPYSCVRDTCLAGRVDRNLWVANRCDECHYFVCEKGNEIPVCPAGYTMNKDNGACYKFNSNAIGWFEQELNCVNDGGHIASIHDQKENDFVVGLTGNDTSFFWSGGKVTTGTTFGWIDKTTFDFTNWGQDRPANPAEQQCLMVQGVDTDPTLTGKWYDIDCTFTVPGVCKMFPSAKTNFVENVPILI